MSVLESRGRSYAGAGTLIRFLLRRERFTLPWWIAGAGLLFVVQAIESQRIYDTPEKLAQLRETMGGNAAVVALSGPTRLLESIGGEVVFEIFSYLAVVVALMNMFLVGRHTRADEETGRAELLRSARVGRHSSLASALWVALLANGCVAVVIALAAIGTGLPVAGSALLGAATGGVGMTFAAFSAAAAQLFSNVRTVYGTVAFAIGAAFLLRALGDVGNGALSWLSPIGWAQRTFPYAGDQWWPLLFLAAASVLLIATAVILLDRRDFGSGLFPSRPGRATASRSLRSPFGLAWRLQRGSFAGWAAGILVLGAAYGSFGDSIEKYVADNPGIADFLPGGASDVIDSYLALTLMIGALLTAAFGVTAALRARTEETSGRVEPLLAGPVGRGSWLGSHVAVALAGSALALLGAGFGEGLAYGLSTSDLGQVPRLMSAALVYVPAGWLVVGLAVLGIGWVPRAATALAWTALGFCSVIALFGDSLDLPNWLRDVSPFAATPQVPLDDVSAPPLLAISALAVALLAIGFAGISRRDIG